MHPVKDITAIDPVTQKNINLWLNGQYDEETKLRIRRMLQEDPKQVIDAFYSHLTFGTGGLRGIMGIGTNRMNVYTVRTATQGLANYMLKQPKETKEHAIFIGYDSRHQSRLFAEEAAKVMAGNGIRVYLCKDIRPTPYVSFGCRYKNCLSGIMITASHNPPEYNGYKVYWSGGGQIVPPHDQGIIAEALKITDPSMVKSVESLSDSLIEEVADEIDNAYLNAVTALQCCPEVNQKDNDQLKIVYTSLHGTGITLIPRAFAAWGFKNVKYVESQIIPDGSFPTVRVPNPEEHAALKMGIEMMLKTNSDILIANDPDADRVGVAVHHEGSAVLLNGNQIAAICLEHVCQALSMQQKLPNNAAFIKTIVTTELFQAICDSYRSACFNVLPGFKYIAQKIHEWELRPDSYQYIFGGEESYGYLLGTYTRDKDAISSSTLICEIALQAKLQGKTLIHLLYDLYHKYGLYEEKLLSLNFGETKEGKEQMALGMQRLRESNLKAINNIPVVTIEDYEASTRYHLLSGKTEEISLPISNVMLYWLADGTKVIVRPSGTEPKVKIYAAVVEKSFSSIQNGLQSCSFRCDGILSFLKNLLLPAG